MGGRSCRRDQCEARRACMIDGAALLPALRGRREEKGRLDDCIWFRSGGPAEWLVRPRDVDDLAAFLGDLDPSVPVLPVGVGSNLIVRDGGVPGVVVRLPKSMAKVSIEPGNRVRAGAAAMGSSVASAARDEIGRASCRERVGQSV